LDDRYHYNFVFEDRFLDSLGQIIGPEHVDEALSVLFWSLSVSPAKWPMVPGVEPVRLCKTAEYLWQGNLTIPQLRIWYYIDEMNIHFLDVLLNHD
jgi:hypothetical protein